MLSREIVLGILKKIVMIDDEKSIQVLAKMALEKIGGFEVIAYDSGPEAIDNILNDKPDLILLDVIMPTMDGPEVFKKLKEIDGVKDIPLFFMTGKSLDSEKDELMNLGADGIVPKPFDPMNLSKTIEAMYGEL